MFLYPQFWWKHGCRDICLLFKQDSRVQFISTSKWPAWWDNKVGVSSGRERAASTNRPGKPAPPTGWWAAALQPLAYFHALLWVLTEYSSLLKARSNPHVSEEIQRGSHCLRFQQWWWGWDSGPAQPQACARHCPTRPTRNMVDLAKSRWLEKHRSWLNLYWAMCKSSIL